MSKKDYILFAEMLKQNRQKIKEAKKIGKKIGVEITPEGISNDIETAIIKIFISNNPNFNYSKFINYVAG